MQMKLNWRWCGGTILAAHWALFVCSDADGPSYARQYRPGARRSQFHRTYDANRHQQLYKQYGDHAVRVGATLLRGGNPRAKSSRSWPDGVGCFLVAFPLSMVNPDDHAFGTAITCSAGWVTHDVAFIVLNDVGATADSPSADGGRITASRLLIYLTLRSGYTARSRLNLPLRVAGHDGAGGPRLRHHAGDVVPVLLAYHARSLQSVGGSGAVILAAGLSPPGARRERFRQIPCASAVVGASASASATSQRLLVSAHQPVRFGEALVLFGRIGHSGQPFEGMRAVRNRRLPASRRRACGRQTRPRPPSRSARRAARTGELTCAQSCAARQPRAPLRLGPFIVARGRYSSARADCTPCRRGPCRELCDRRNADVIRPASARSCASRANAG